MWGIVPVKASNVPGNARIRQKLLKYNLTSMWPDLVGVLHMSFHSVMVRLSKISWVSPNLLFSILIKLPRSSGRCCAAYRAGVNRIFSN